MNYKEVEGNLITMALEGAFDVIAHGVNCMCVQKSGLAPQMVKAFGTDHFPLEIKEYEEYYEDDENHTYKVRTNNKGDINKLGQIDFQIKYIWFNHPMGGPRSMNSRSKGQKDTQELIVVNAYTQYNYGRNHSDGDSVPVDYEAITLCMRKINKVFAGKYIGLPGLIGCGLAGGDEEIVKNIIKKELKDCNVTIVNYKK